MFDHHQHHKPYRNQTSLDNLHSKLHAMYLFTQSSSQIYLSLMFVFFLYFISHSTYTSLTRSPYICLKQRKLPEFTKRFHDVFCDRTMSFGVNEIVTLFMILMLTHSQHKKNYKKCNLIGN